MEQRQPEQRPAVPSRTGVGIYQLTYPATVYDEIPTGFPGATPAGFAVNLRGAWASTSNVAALYEARAFPTAPNVLTVYLWTFIGGAFVLADAPVTIDPNPADWLAIGVCAL